MNQNALIQRLAMAHPGWAEWDLLVSLVGALNWEYVVNEYCGDFFISGNRLTFRSRPMFSCPDWMPNYVPALIGMKADSWEMAGGYADDFGNHCVKRGAIFSPAGNDTQLGYPLIDAPADGYYFQSNTSGALFYVDTKLDFLFPCVSTKRFAILDSLDDFTKTCIRQTIAGTPWFEAYSRRIPDLMD